MPVRTETRVFGRRRLWNASRGALFGVAVLRCRGARAARDDACGPAVL